MSDKATQKATAATSETMDEVFHEAIRSYEKALKSGIQLQEESVNLWKELFTKLGSPEELQAKLESMTAAAFPQARQRMEEFVETFNRRAIRRLICSRKRWLFTKPPRCPSAAPRAGSDRKLADHPAGHRSQRP
jgi:hypothetical protein